MEGIRAKDEIRTRDPDLGKVVLYQLSYFRVGYFTFASVCLISLLLRLWSANIGRNEYSASNLIKKLKVFYKSLSFKTSAIKSFS